MSYLSIFTLSLMLCILSLSIKNKSLFYSVSTFSLYSIFMFACALSFLKFILSLCCTYSYPSLPNLFIRTLYFYYVIYFLLIKIYISVSLYNCFIYVFIYLILIVSLYFQMISLSLFHKIIFI